MNYKMLSVLLSILLSACTTISQFDQQSYNSATSIKVDALNLMDSAINSYTSQQVRINFVTAEISKAYEYDKNRPKNVMSTAMWSKLKDTNSYLFGGFINRWKKEQSLKPVFIQDAKSLIDSAFDQISQLESGKIKSSQTTK